MPRTTGSSSSSTVAGVPRSTRSTAPRGDLEVRLRSGSARWVATPETSAHVSGDAVDIGPSAAAAWLSGARRRVRAVPVYGNEPWHYELRPRPSITAARRCTPTRPTIQGCSTDEQTAARPFAVVALIGRAVARRTPRGTGDRRTARRQEAHRSRKAVKFAECIRDHGGSDFRTRTRIERFSNTGPA
jgi:hypothetical protein